MVKRGTGACVCLCEYGGGEGEEGGGCLSCVCLETWC